MACKVWGGDSDDLILHGAFCPGFWFLLLRSVVAWGRGQSPCVSGPRLPVSSLGCPLQGQLAVILCGNSLCGNGRCCGCVVLMKAGESFQWFWGRTCSHVRSSHLSCAGTLSSPETHPPPSPWKPDSVLASLLSVVFLRLSGSVCLSLRLFPCLVRFSAGSLCSLEPVFHLPQPPRLGSQAGATTPLLPECLGLQVGPRAH